MTISTGDAPVKQLISKADVVLANQDMYLESKQLEDFKAFVAVAKRTHSGWTDTLQAHDCEDPDLRVEGKRAASNPRTWESVDEATSRLDKEVSTIDKRRFAAELDGLLTSVCWTKSSKKKLRRMEFPQDLTDSLHQVIDALEPQQRLDQLIHSVRKTLKQRGASSELERLLREIEAELVDRQQIGRGGKKKISLMHRAAFGGMDDLLRALIRMTGRLSNVNARDSDGQTPLHYATIAGRESAVNILLGNENLQANQEDAEHQTALQIAVQMQQKRIERLLMERAEVQQYVDRLSADRQVYVDAANAILVGASLIASVTFGSWLSPPLGYVPYYNITSPYPAAPADSYESFAAVNEYVSLRIFWAFNSLSFFASLATIIAGAGCALPNPESSIEHQVKVVRRIVVLASTLMVFSIIFVLGAFAAAGFASLPPIPKYTTNILVTVVVGTGFCVGLLIWFMAKLYAIRPEWWIRIEEETFGMRQSGDKKRKEKDLHFIS